MHTKYEEKKHTTIKNVNENNQSSAQNVRNSTKYNVQYSIKYIENKKCMYELSEQM